MQILIGNKIRELRHRDGRKQEDLADALGVTCQAVSRWEAAGGYPDLEIIPAIANYFHISIVNYQISCNVQFFYKLTITHFVS